MTSLPGEIYAIRKIVYNVGDMRRDLGEYLGRVPTVDEILDHIKNLAMDDLADSRNMVLYDPEMDRDIC